MPNPSKMMAKKPMVEFTPERKLVYLESLRNTGLVYLSAEFAGVVSRTVQEHRKRDPEFNEACEEAKQWWIDNVLVAEAIKRATVGLEEPIIGGKDRDEIVAYKRVVSDGLLTTLLKSSRQEFRTGEAEGGVAGGSSPVMFIPQAAPSTMDDWEKRYGEDAKGQKGKPK
ncbi:terminase small subunit [Stenotrophomonas phage Sonora]|nr:terminase small subunit [Stenotrophomonas phage Sonora]